MKRKDVEESCDDFSLACISNLSRKFPRLDEDPNVNGSLERGLSLEQPWTSNAMVHSEAAIVDAHPTSNASEERALVLYDPTKIHFVKSPSPPEFSIVVKSNMIPELRDYLSSWGYALEKSTANRKSKREENDNEGSRDSLAVVPWVGFHSPIVCEERVSAACHPIEAEVEMMDTDEPYVISSNEKDMEIGENAEAIGSFPPRQQQHYMMLYNVPVILVIFIFLSTLSHAGQVNHTDHCDPTMKLDPMTLRSDQITVLINGYSESRIPLLQSISATYSASPRVSSVLVLWGNPYTPHHILTQLSHNLSISSLGAASISLHPHPSTTLNARFLPRRAISTRAVLICDDDVHADHKSLEFAFRVWESNPHRLIGLFARSHGLDLTTREWIYTVHPDKYSIILTKFMIFSSEYLYKYSCEGGPQMAEMRKTVDLMRNCEDILMNFVVADAINVGPILVGAERVRDYGDPRNDENGRTRLKGEEGNNKGVRDVGLSSRRSEHRKRRGQCIMEFHRVMGRMPLRYNFGKVVNSIGEQGLCEKKGKLVFCDQ